MSTDSAYQELVRRAEERSERLGDPRKQLTRCADAACNYRMTDASVEWAQPAKVDFAAAAEVLDWVGARR